ncbi:hypothetical protein AB8880_10805 [Alphaproteobacteria bacterium LSUCC0684]
MDVLSIDNGVLESPSISNVNLIYLKTFRKDKEISFLFTIYYFIRLVRQYCYGKYSSIIFVGERSLLFSPFFIFTKSKNIFFNLELYFKEDFKLCYLYFLYKLYIKHVKYVFKSSIIQDRPRARLFSALYKFPINRISFFPNITTYGTNVQSNYPSFATENIVLYSGSLQSKWGSINKFIDNLKFKNYILFLNSRLPKVTNLTDNKSIIFNSNLSLKNYDSLVRQIKIGIAYYDRDYSCNIKYVGLSSGKILHYLKYGKPIIINEIPYWSSVISKYNIGIVLSDFNDLDQAIKKILDDYDYYSDNASLFYSKILSDINFRNILKLM